MRKASLDAAVVTSGVNIRYYSGFTSSEAIFLVTHEHTYLVTDFRYTIQANAQTMGLCEVVEASFSEQLNRIQDFLAQDGCKRAGFEEDVLSVSELEQGFREVLSAVFSREATERRAALRKQIWRRAA